MAETYPDIPWPSNAVADALDGTTDDGTQVPYVDKGTDETSSPTLNVQENRNKQRVLNLLGRAAAGSVWSESTALNVGAFPMRYQLAGTQYYFEGATGSAVTDNDISYVYLDSDATLKVVTDAVGWPADESTYIKLAEVTASGGAITSVKDLRCCNLNLVTDLGTVSETTSATIQLDSGGGGPKLKAQDVDVFGLRNAADDDYVNLQAGDVTVVDLTASGELAVTDVAAFGSSVTVTGQLEANGAVHVDTAAGIDYQPGSDIDVDVVTVAVTGTPKLWWDESEDSWSFTHSINLAAGKTLSIDANDLIVPYSPSFYFSGTMSVKVLELEWVAPVDFTIVAATGRVNAAPTGAALICDVRVDGNSIFSNQAEMINIADAAQQDTSATKNHAVTAGEVITCEIEQIGSGNAGDDLTVVLNGRCKLQE